MISLSTTALVAIPATHVVSRLASGVADIGRNFLSVLQESPDSPDSESEPLAQSNPIEIQKSPSENSAKSPLSTKPATLADLIQAIQSLIANLSDDSDSSVTIQSLSDEDVQVTGDEPLASKIKQWTQLHTEWGRDWNVQAATGSGPTDAPLKKLSAKISATSFDIETD